MPQDHRGLDLRPTSAKTATAPNCYLNTENSRAGRRGSVGNFSVQQSEQPLTYFAFLAIARPARVIPRHDQCARVLVAN
jgi:hypothetical protein